MANEGIIYKNQHVVCNITKNHYFNHSQLAENCSQSFKFKIIFLYGSHM